MDVEKVGLLIIPQFSTELLDGRGRTDVVADPRFVAYRDEYADAILGLPKKAKERLINAILPEFYVFDEEAIDRAYTRLLRSVEDPTERIVQIHYFRSLLLFAFQEGIHTEDMYLDCCDRLFEDCLIQILQQHFLENRTDAQNSSS